jgi:DNA-binding NarL/FixJ family response regulator
MARPTVLLADDHTIVTEGLASILKDDFDVLAVVADGMDLLAAARTLRPDIIVTDLSMPHLSGLEAARQLRAEHIPSQIIVLTMHDDPEIAAEAFRAGVAGYLLKSSAGTELILAIQQIVKGQSYVSPLLSRDVMTELAAPRRRSDEVRSRGVTPRQRDVLRLIARGKRMKEIAVTLGVSVRTVESHKYEMMESLGVSSTAELIQYAFRTGLAADTTPAKPAIDRHQ